MLVTTYTSGHIIGGRIVEALEAWRAKSLSCFVWRFECFVEVGTANRCWLLQHSIFQYTSFIVVS